MPRVRRIIAALAAVALFVGFALAVRAWGFGLVRISGTSMNDTLADGDVVFVTRLERLTGRAPAFGQIVECTFPGRRDTYIKRVAGLPGDTVAFEGGEMIRNGARISEPYVSGTTADYAIALGADEYLLLGDNRQASYDSRMDDMGPVGRDAFIGRVRLIVWPLSRFGTVD